jgi:purine nucleosidase
MMGDDIQTNHRKPLLFDHRGSFDDFVALIALLTLKQYRLTGVTVLQGQKCTSSAVEATLRILSYIDEHSIEVAFGETTVETQMPKEHCDKSKRINSIKLLAKQDTDFLNAEQQDAPGFIVRKILNEDEKTTLVMTGPADNVAQAIENNPEIVEKIERIIWVAGAFLSDGNVIAPDHDCSAEWNIYHNPITAATILKSGVPIFMFPLDVTQHLPVDNYLTYHLKKNKKKRFSKLAYKILEPEFDLRSNKMMASVVASVYLAYPNIFQFDSKSIAVEQRGTSKGNIYRTSLGSKVKHAIFVDDDKYYDLLIKLLKKG